MPNPYSVAGGVVLSGDLVLLLEAKGKGEFRLPKGHVEPGENRERAALREVIEETGYRSPVIVASLGSTLNTFAHEGEQVCRYETYFLMHLKDERWGARREEEVRKFDVLWTTVEDAMAKLTFESEREFLRRAIAFERVRPPTPEQFAEGV